MNIWRWEKFINAKLSDNLRSLSITIDGLVLDYQDPEDPENFEYFEVISKIDKKLSFPKLKCFDVRCTYEKDFTILEKLGLISKATPALTKFSVRALDKGTTLYKNDKKEVLEKFFSLPSLKSLNVPYSFLPDEKSFLKNSNLQFLEIDDMPNNEKALTHLKDLLEDNKLTKLHITFSNSFNPFQCLGVFNILQSTKTLPEVQFNCVIRSEDVLNILSAVENHKNSLIIRTNYCLTEGDDQPWVKRKFEGSHGFLEIRRDQPKFLHYFPKKKA